MIRQALRMRALSLSLTLNWRVAAAAVLCGRLVDAREADESAAHSAVLDYVASDRCPGPVTFETQVRARTSRLRFVTAAPRIVRVRISELRGEFSGKLELVENEKIEVQQTVDGPICDEVVAALAVVAALEVDDSADEVVEVPRRAAPEIAPTTQASGRWGLWAQGGFRSGQLEFPAVTLSMGLARTPVWQNRGERGGWGALWLGASYTSAGAAERTGLRTETHLINGQIDLCIFPVGLGERQVSWPCAAVDVGALLVSTQPGQSAAVPWGALGLALRPEWALSEGFSLELRFAVQLALVRHRFLLASEFEDAQLAPLLVTGSLGLRFDP